MEKPWLILRRVLVVRPGAEEQENAQAQQEQLAAGVEDAVVAALEESILDANLNMMVSKGAHKMMRARGRPDITIDVAPPPRVSALVTGPGAHPDPRRPDMHPYIIATGRFCLLVHFVGSTKFHQDSNHSHLVVVRYFLRDDDGARPIVACADRVPDRPDDVNLPALCNIDSVGLACNQQTGDILIAELIVTTASTGAPLLPQDVVVYNGSRDTNGWQGDHYVNPLMREDPLRDWVPHGTVTINSTFVWYDLSWGIISSDLAQPRQLQVLNFHPLPPGRVLSAGDGDLPDLHCRRCIAVSENLVRYVEIILEPPNQAATTVNMWYLDMEADPWRWNINYTESFEEIWADESYQQAWLPRNIIPMLVGVSPVNSSVVYFSLNQRLFGVNVPEHRVVHCQEYEPLPGPPPDKPTSRYLITWNLDVDQAPNVGHHPNQPSDHVDSSPSAPADEGDID